MHEGLRRAHIHGMTSRHMTPPPGPLPPSPPLCQVLDAFEARRLPACLGLPPSPAAVVTVLPAVRRLLDLRTAHHTSTGRKGGWHGDTVTRLEAFGPRAAHLPAQREGIGVPGCEGPSSPMTHFQAGQRRTCQSSAAAAPSLPRSAGRAPPPSRETYGGGKPSWPAIKKYAALA